MRVHTICETHKTTAIVGPGTPLSELECVTCIAIQDGRLPAPAPTDPEGIFISRITRHYGGECCCESCDPSFCYDCGHYYGFCVCPRPVCLTKNAATIAWRRPRGDEPPF